MPVNDELNITVKLDTQAARRELMELREYAMATLSEIIERYAALGLTPGATYAGVNTDEQARRV